MTSRYLATILSFMLFLGSCTKKTTSTNSRNDSVEKYLKLATIDTLPTEIRKNYNHKAFSFIDLEKNDTTVRWYLSEITFKSIILKDTLNFHKTSNLYKEKSQRSKDTLNVAKFYRYLGNYHRLCTKKYDSSYYYYIRSEKLFKKLNDEEGLAKLLLMKGTLQHLISDYEGAEYSSIKAYNYFKNKNNYRFLYGCYNSLGNTYHSLAKYDKAITYHKEALKIINKVYSKDGFSNIGSTLNNIGNAYRELEDFENAIYYFKKALSNKIELKKDDELRGFLYNNLGYCYLNQNKYEQLPFLFEEAAKIFDSLNIKSEAAISRIYLSNYYTEIKDTTKAIFYVEKALKLAKESKSSYYYLFTLSSAGTINKQKAPEYIAEYHRLNDSLLFEERKARNQYFKIQLETDEIAQQKEKAIKQKWVQTSIIASVLSIVILLFIIYKQRSQKKEFILGQNQQKANEEIYQLMLNQQSKEEEAKQKEKKRIAIELHDNVMNKLASTRFNLFSLTKKSDVQSLEQAVHHIDSIKEVEDEIRNITHELSKETFSKSNSFASLLTQMITEQNQIHSTHYQLELDTTINWDIISSEIKMNYYRIIQEAIHNCNKYAVASHCTISLLYEMNQLFLTISDNGKGFEVEAAKQGIGLQNMKQRMQSIEGNISINSELGKGTAINCSVEIDVNL